MSRKLLDRIDELSNRPGQHALEAVFTVLVEQLERIADVLENQNAVDSEPVTVRKGRRPNFYD